MGTATYLPFLCEMENYLSSQNADTNMFVGATAEFQRGHRALQAGHEPAENGAFPPQDGQGEKFRERLTSAVERAMASRASDVHLQQQPVSRAFTCRMPDPAKRIKKETLAQWAQAFNVDTRAGRPLQRVSYEDVKTGVSINARGPGDLRGQRHHAGSCWCRVKPICRKSRCFSCCSWPYSWPSRPWPCT